MVLKNTFVLNENLVYDELAMMKNARYSAPIALLNDKFIVVAGGSNSNVKGKFTNSAEIFDIVQNKWTPMENLQKARSNTSMCAVANRLVFIFNGLPSTLQPNYNNAIEYIDLGNFDIPSVRNAKWESIVVQNNEFILSEPRGSSQVSLNELIVFGGHGNHTFNFDITNILVTLRNSQKPGQFNARITK